MITYVRNWGDRVFPEFQILFRRGGRVIYLNVTASRQITIAAVALCLILAFAYVGLRFQHFGNVVLSRNHMLAEAGRAKTDLNQQVDALRDTLAEAESRAEAVGEDNDKLMARLVNAQQRVASLEGERDRAVAQANQEFIRRDAARSKALAEANQEFNRRDAARLKALAEAQQRIGELDNERTRLQSDRTEIEHKLGSAQDKLNSKSTNLVQLSKELDKNRDLLRHSDSNQVALQTRIQSLEKDLAMANLNTDKFKSDLASIETKLDGLKAERDRMVARRDSAQRDAQAARQADAAATRVALVNPAKPAADADETAAPLQLKKGSGGKIEALIASTSLDMHKLLSDVGDGPAHAEGGPFVPLGDATRIGADARRHKMLEKLAETLPLRAPLDHYRVESPFGARHDPFNHRRGFHTGVDLSAPYRTHVFSTAPGIVIFAGAEGGWGRLVEIDNGHGIVTRYAHMHRIFVVKGQKVPAHFAIGELGSTGRSTGPHVHYEVVVDGTAVDPTKFLGAGDNVIRVGARQ